MLATTRSWAAAMHALARAGGSISLERADSIRCPVLLIVGENDRLVSPDDVRRLSERIPNVEMRIIPGVAHNTHAARGVTERIVEWLAAH
jgi:pimeloyl-ACP methyl ester carboxylesterase